MSMPFVTPVQEPHVNTRGYWAVEIFRHANAEHNELLATVYGITRTQVNERTEAVLKALQAM